VPVIWPPESHHCCHELGSQQGGDNWFPGGPVGCVLDTDESTAAFIAEPDPGLGPAQRRFAAYALVYRALYGVGKVGVQSHFPVVPACTSNLGCGLNSHV
jgi:hypothetical protein